ncbi:TonB-dependent receptor [Novosphingobium flavum]|uniref:TonB-dependent receptor n=1 Tax=Novosphingobium flavum TaxID=1778672 RepID=A0A7X1KKU8_9SPHN|nr:TonB-dependent receptor [Novosphingobium flavum]MBC2664931.1 TonB-dependent receptor [Novosphingobium flavum]
MGGVSSKFGVRLLNGAATSAILAFAMTGAAQAQSAPAEDTADEAIVVTGTRLITNGNDMPTPVTIVTTEKLLQTNPSSVTAALQTLPVFQGMRTPTTAPGNSRQNNAARVLNLRNLGRLRTLSMFDGHRLAPSSPEAETDVTFIPSMLVKRVDVVTGGASAVYGSDAVSGVVNFITDRDFNGLKLDTHYGISSRGDGPEFKVGIAGGTKFADGRGHFEASYEYLNSPGIADKASRDFGAALYTVQGSGTAAAPYIYVSNTHLNGTTFGGYIVNTNANNGNPLKDYTFTANGVLAKFQHGASVVTGTSTVTGVEIGGDGAYYNKTMLQAQARSHVGYARLDYDLTDSVHFYTNASLWKTHNRNTNVNNGFSNVVMSSTNAFLPKVYQDQMLAANISTFTFSRLFDNVTPTDSETDTDGHMAVLGFEGDLGSWKWDAFYSNSRNKQRTWANANVNNARAFAALDAVDEGLAKGGAANGNIVCNVTVTNPGLFPGCVPLNIFGPTANTAQAMAYILDRTEFTATTWMDEFGGSIAGSPFATWAGPVQVALSGEYRNLRYQQLSTAEPVATNCTGLRFGNCKSTTLIYAGNVLASGPQVGQKVHEAALEVEVPLLKNVPFVRSLSINGAARYTNYNTSGEVGTWKVGLNWEITDSLKLRATRSREIRAPNLNELFAPRLVQVSASTRDSHTTGISTGPLITDPNPNLKPEVAQVWTGGVVWNPPFIRGLSLTLDAYKISINNAITQIQGQDVNTQKLCEDSGGTSEFCSLIVRPGPFSDTNPATNLPTAWLSQPRNALKLETWGADFEVNYATQVAGGDFSVRGLVSYQPHYYLTLPGGSRLDAAGAGIGPCCQLDGLSRWRATAFLGYRKNGISVDIQERFLSGVRWDPNPLLVFNAPNPPGVAYTNITLGAEAGKHLEFYLSVQNLFDQQPTPWGRISHSALPGLMGGFVPGQDVIGRYVTVGARMKL